LVAVIDILEASGIVRSTRGHVRTELSLDERWACADELRALLSRLLETHPRIRRHRGSYRRRFRSDNLSATAFSVQRCAFQFRIALRCKHTPHGSAVIASLPARTFAGQPEALFYAHGTQAWIGIAFRAVTEKITVTAGGYDLRLRRQDDLARTHRNDDRGRSLFHPIAQSDVMRVRNRIDDGNLLEAKDTRAFGSLLLNVRLH
jgi:hypothetical protein